MPKEGLVLQRFVRLSFFSLLLTLPHLALAQVTPAAGFTPPDETQSTTIGAVVFYNYSYTKAPTSADTAGNQIHPNSFDVARTYINVNGRISSVVQYRITPDISRETGTGPSLNGSLIFRLKYGYANIALDRWTGNWTGSYVRVGIQQTAFIDAEESVYRYRFQGTVYAERDGGLPSADAGVVFHSNIPNNYGDFVVGIYNGEGYTKPDVNDQKSIQVRGTFRPLASTNSAIGRGLRFTGYYNADHLVKDADRNRAIGSVWIEQRRYNAGVDCLSRSDEASPTAARVKSGGCSFFVTPFFKEKGNGLEALIRYDQFKPNKSADPRQDRTIVGVAYWFPHSGGNSTAALLLDFEQVKINKPAAPTPTSQKIFLHGLINF